MKTEYETRNVTLGDAIAVIGIRAEQMQELCRAITNEAMHREGKDLQNGIITLMGCMEVEIDRLQQEFTTAARLEMQTRQTEKQAATDETMKQIIANRRETLENSGETWDIVQAAIEGGADNDKKPMLEKIGDMAQECYLIGFETGLYTMRELASTHDQEGEQ